MYNTELIESLESIIKEKELYSFHQDTEDFINMYLDNFPSLFDIKFSGNFKSFFIRCADRYGLIYEEMITSLVFHQHASPDTMSIALWALKNIMPRKLCQMRAKHLDNSRKDNVQHTLLSEITYCSFYDMVSYWDVRKMTAQEIINYLGEQECFS